MPPKKRALEEADTNVQSARDAKQQKRDEAEKGTEKQQQTDAEPNPDTEKIGVSHEELEKLKPEEYICLDRPHWDRESNHEDDDEAEEDEIESSSKQSSGPKMWAKPAAEHPEWKWITMWKSWQLLCDYSIREGYTIPDCFGMYIFNDFHGYGMIELAENAVAEFHKEHGKKDRSLHLMWAPIAMIGYWLNNNDNMMEMTMADDGNRVAHLVYVMGHALLAALHAIDRAGKLTEDSEFRDLGLVMTLYLRWSHDEDDWDEEDSDEDGDGNGSWRAHVVGYAKKAGIDLKTVGCELHIELEDVEDAEPLGKSRKADRWDWKKIFTEYANDHGVRKGQIGGQEYDITKMSSKKRASYAFDKVDPLKDVPADVLKENRLDWQ